MIDELNGLFAFMGGLFAWFNVKQIIIDKEVKGYNLFVFFFFTIWSCWSLYYYSSIHQVMSFYGSITIAIANLVWLIFAIYYKYR